MFIPNLMFEMTRNCNMHCIHCLRGEPQNNVTFPTNYLHNVFSGIENIGTVIFSGGEPLFQIHKIITILNDIRAREISLDGFCIISNGTIYSEKLMEVLKHLYEFYCVSTEACSFEISLDKFHDASDKVKMNVSRYEELKELHKYEFIHLDARNIPYYTLINEGRASKLSNTVFTKDNLNPNKFFHKLETDSFMDDHVYISANGNVVASCNMSYEHIDHHSLGNIREQRLFDIVTKNAILDEEEYNTLTHSM